MKNLAARLLPSLIAACSCVWHGSAHAEGAGFDEEIVVVAPTPVAAGLGIAPDKLPFTSQAADADAMERAQSLDVTDFLQSNLGSVSVNSAQNNPLQPDVQYRGYSASPLLGLPMGVSVYQNGVRVNEPLGDAVNWDLLPESAIHSVTLVGGANPLFGLNTLGGALSVDMKDGFNFSGSSGEVTGGSWGRVSSSAESGGNNGRFGYYANVSYFDEAGWRDMSNSDALNVFGALSWRGERSAIDLSLQYGDTDLRGNGPAPIGLLALDREQAFTAPDITQNELYALTLELKHDFNDTLEVAGNGFYRELDTSSFNGDASPYTACALGAGNFLLQGLDKNDLENVGLSVGDVCVDNVLGASNPAALEQTLNGLAGASGAFDIGDLTNELNGTGVLSDSAIINRSARAEESYGTDAQLVFTRNLVGRENYFVAGASYYHGNADFDSTVELARLDPVTRNTEGLGVGTFVSSEATRVATETATWSMYFLDNLALTERFALTLGGRYNDTTVEIRDRSGARPELDGRHGFSRFNPTAGGTFSVHEDLNLFASYSESSRAPTPIELSCNEGVFEIARRLAVENGQDPNSVAFECRLPNAFLADPPLKQVVAESIETGVRGVIRNTEYRAGYFRTTNNDDIIFQSTGRNTGLFANVDQTQRQGVEVALAGSWKALEWSTTYSYVEATFESPFAALSPNHPEADANGEIQVEPGDRIPGIPRHQFKLGADYTFASGFRLGADLLLNSDQVMRGDEANLLDTVDGYALVNLRASYELRTGLEMFVRVTNLFDTDYENFGLVGEDPTEVLPGLADARPYFLSAGAPRGAWVGVRARF